MISVDGKVFKDREGRQLIFNGINLVCKEKEKNYLGGYDIDLFSHFKEWGFNLVRLGIIWDGVEPEPGIYDDVYIKEIGKYMDMCHKNGIRVFLDMHQDLFSVKYSDGAPDWATLNNNEPHTEGGKWSDSYLLSSAVQASFDNFWGDTPASDGIGIMTHYMKAWLRVLSLLGDHPSLIGVDFINEPFPGTEAQQIYGAVFTSFGNIIGKLKGKQISPEETAAIFNDSTRMADSLMLMDDKETYSFAVNPLADAISRFDKESLNGFYEKMTKAVRTAGYDGIIMQENNYFSNAGIPSQIEYIMSNGEKEPAQAYSPHGYDLVVDTEGVGILSSEDRVSVIFENHRKVQERLGVPVIVGEWGAFGHYNGTLEHCKHIISMFEEYQWSNTYWCWHDKFEEVPVLEVLKRAYPMKTAGRLIEYSYNYEKKEFTMKWEETFDYGSTEIYLPFIPGKCPDGYKIQANKNSCLLITEHTGGMRKLSIEK